MLIRSAENSSERLKMEKLCDLTLTLPERLYRPILTYARHLCKAIGKKKHALSKLKNGSWFSYISRNSKLNRLQSELNSLHDLLEGWLEKARQHLEKQRAKTLRCVG